MEKVITLCYKGECLLTSGVRNSIIKMTVKRIRNPITRPNVTKTYIMAGSPFPPPPHHTMLIKSNNST